MIIPPFFYLKTIEISLSTRFLPKISANKIFLQLKLKKFYTFEAVFCQENRTIMRLPLLSTKIPQETT